jgi:hypothetical protein
MKRGLLFALLICAACGPSKDRGVDGGGGDGDGGPDPFQDAPCPTAITGKVFAPNGTLPLYNITVYAPIQDPPPFIDGVTCGTCTAGLPGGAYTSAQTDSMGRFRLEGVPAGQNIPVIITTGKWRRKLIVPNIAACTDTAIPDGDFRLPKNRMEGDIPRIAMVTGGCDGLACILSKIGLDASEFGPASSGPHRVVWYTGVSGTQPGTPANATALWGSLDEMKKFDVIINSCECSENNQNKTSPDLLRQYADLGGRVFGSHFHYTWSKNLIPAWLPTATWMAGSASPAGMPERVDTSHPVGMAMAEWLVTVGASTMLGQITLGTKLPNASMVTAPTKRWLYSSAAANPTSHYLSFETPVGAAMGQSCGKVVYAGMHISGTGTSVGTSFPAACSANFTPDEKALVFLLFDLTACVGQIF